MNIKIILNEDILIWYLLFKQSISKELNEEKQKIWYNYKECYNDLFKEQKILLKDPKNYIPNDDTIYNIVKELSIYDNIYKYTEKYKLTLVKNWDTLKKELRSIIKMDINDYDIYLVDPRLNTCVYLNKLNTNTLIYGVKKTNSRDEILDLMYHLVRIKLEKYYKKNKDITMAVIELAIKNELATRISGRSHYLEGNETLKLIKRKIYPYFLMYLGVSKKDFIKYMKRDGIIFDNDYYEYRKELKRMDIGKFIDFCIKLSKEKVKETETLEII